MIKKICKIGIMFFIIMLCICGKSYGVHKEVSGKEVILVKYMYFTTTTSTGGYEDFNAISKTINKKILEALQDYYNYEGDLTENIQFNTTINVTNNGDETYDVRIGDFPNTDKNISFNDLKQKYAWNDKDALPTEGNSMSYDVIIRAKVKKDFAESIVREDKGDDNYSLYYVLYATDIYNGEEPTDKLNSGAINPIVYDYEGKNEIINDVIDGARHAIDIATILITHPVQTILTWFLDVLRAVFGDFPQMLANQVQKLGVTFTYSSNEIPDEYKTWVNINTSNDLADYTYSVDVVNGSTYFGIGGDTNLSDDAPEIPVIPTDIYSLAKGNIAILDINFLNGQSDKDEDELGDKIWLTIRNFISAIIRAVYYIVAALLLTSLIWHGINIVKGSLTPKAAQEHREGLNRFVKSLLMLVGTILIMALSIFASQMFLEDISDSDSEELPIRVCVTNYDGNGTTLSFSTNFTGYLRFMSETEDVTNCFQKGAYTLSYIVVAIFNSVAAFGMFLRMLVMMCLAIVGAVVVGRYALTNNEKAMTDYRIWAKVFITLALVQVVLAIIVRVLFECAL